MCLPFVYLCSNAPLYVTGIEVDLTGDHTHNQSASPNWLGAKSCLHRSAYSTELAPPTHDMDEACRRYRIPHPPADSAIDESLSNSDKPGRVSDCSIASGGTSATCLRDRDATHGTPPPPYASLEAPPTPAGLEEVKYEVLMTATSQFDRTPYKEGGHKVGEGGFGEVFQCSLVLQNGPVNVAVKVLHNQVCFQQGVAFQTVPLLVTLTVMECPPPSLDVE